MKKSPKFLRTIRSNKAPIILDQSFGMKVEPYSKLDPNLIKKRAELVKTNEKFSQNVCNIRYFYALLKPFVKINAQKIRLPTAVLFN